MYAPTKDRQKEQLQFVDYLGIFLKQHEGKNLILAGDFNTYLNYKLDKKGGSIGSESKYSKQLNSLCEEFDLLDIWRTNNLTECKLAGIVQSRLDFFLKSRHLNYQISDSNLKPGFKSDHSLIKLVVDLLHTHQRGKGYWKFNNSLLNDKTYVQLIKEELKQLATNRDIQNKCCF